MKKFFITIASLVIAVVAFIWGVTWFLTVDDLAGCPPTPNATAKCQPADVVVAVSGGDTQARVREAVLLYKAGWAPQIIFSGAAKDQTGLSNAAAMTQQAINLGVPARDITAEELSVDTAANAIRVASIAKQYSVRRMIVVTSPYHQRRADMEFTRALGGTIAIVGHPAPHDALWDRNTWWMSASGWRLTVGELSKIMYISTMERSL